jgi:hypothetical protein
MRQCIICGLIASSDYDMRGHYGTHRNQIREKLEGMVFENHQRFWDIGHGKDKTVWVVYVPRRASRGTLMGAYEYFRIWYAEEGQKRFNELYLGDEENW